MCWHWNSMKLNFNELFLIYLKKNRLIKLNNWSGNWNDILIPNILFAMWKINQNSYVILAQNFWLLLTLLYLVNLGCETKYKKKTWIEMESELILVKVVQIIYNNIITLYLSHANQTVDMTNLPPIWLLADKWNKEK